MKQYLMFLGGGRWQEHGIKTAKKMGIQVLVVDGDPKAIGFYYADISLNIDFYNNYNSVLLWLEDNKINLMGVLSYCNEKRYGTCRNYKEKI